MGKVNDPSEAAVVFFWANGTRFVAFPAAMTYFRTRDQAHYDAIVNIYNTYGVPFYEEPTSKNIDSRIFGIEIRPQEDVWTGTEVEYENQKDANGKPLPVNSGKGAKDTMKRSFQATNGQTYRNSDKLDSIIATQKVQGEAIAALTQAIKDLPGSIETVHVTG